MSTDRPPSPRMLHVIESTTAGVRRYVTYLLQHQSSTWQTEVACPATRQGNFGDVAFVNEVKQLGVPVHNVHMRRTLGWSDTVALRELQQVIQHGQYDLIHTHSSKAGFLGRLSAHSCGVPVIHTPNGLYYLGQRGFKRWLYRTLEQLAGRWTTQLIAVSHGECEVIARDRLVPPELLCVIENGVDVHEILHEAALPAGRELCNRYGFNERKPIIGSAGRLVPQKDPLTFVRAAARLRAQWPDALFVWCGDGELRGEMERLAAQLHVPLLLTGHQENSAAIMQAFHMFVLPSLYEGLPFSLLEAMALGIPIVATDIIGIREVLGQEPAGWLAMPQDDAALAFALAQAWSQPAEAQHRAQAARQRVETHYSVERMIEQHLALYERILQQRPRK